jgi:hypothetical protein
MITIAIMIPATVNTASIPIPVAIPNSPLKKDATVMNHHHSEPWMLEERLPVI